MKTGVKFLLAIIVVIVFVGVVVLNAQAQPHDEVWVDDDASPDWYDSQHVKTIQEGIDNASVGGTVYVWDGNYNEDITVNKTVTIIGNTTVDALNGIHQNRTNLSYDSHGFWIEADYVNISGFSLHCVGSDASGVHLNESDFCNISGNVIMYDGSDGICLENSSYNTIFNNILRYNYYGIYLFYSPNNTFINCIAIDNYYGLYAYYSDYLHILGGNYSHNGHPSEGYLAVNIYVVCSNNTLIDDVIVDEPIHGPAFSCTFIYTWNGTEFEFINEQDLGELARWAYEGGNLDFELWEENPFYRTPVVPINVNFLEKVESEQLQPQDDKYMIRFTEEMDEVSYADLLELWTVDHEPGVEFYTDWTLRDNLFTVVDPQPPVWAFDHNGNNVTPLISALDWDEWISEVDDLVYQGLTLWQAIVLNNGGWIRLKLGNWTETPEHLKLVITENKELGYNETVYDQVFEMVEYFEGTPGLMNLYAMNGGPVIKIKNGVGGWTDAPKAYQRIEVPVGLYLDQYLYAYNMPRTYVLNLSGLEIPDNEILFWVTSPFQHTHIDQILVDISEPQPLAVNVLKPSYADLHYRGSTPKGRMLLANRMNEWNFEYDYYDGFFDIDYSYVIETHPSESGNFTRFGDVLPLLLSIDDEFVVMGTGDEVSLQFYYTAPQEGLVRDFVFREFGYKKAPVLATGDSVNPLPFRNMTMYPYNESIENYDYDNHTDYLTNYQTRFSNGHHSALGIYIVSTTNLTINNARGIPENEYTDEYGILIENCQEGTITNCRFADGWEYGFYIYYSNNCTISHNEISDNKYGILVESSSNDTITYNQLINNTGGGGMTGVHLTGGSNDNELHRNCFIDNLEQAWDDGLRNNWDNNYWNDYPLWGGVHAIGGSALSQDPFTLGQCPLEERPGAQVPTLTSTGMLLLIGFIILLTIIVIRRKR